MENITKLAKNIKLLEKSFEHILPGNKPFIVRLDGVNFKDYTAILHKPFDPDFTHALKVTTQNLVQRTAATVGFCQSDEITLVLGPAKDGDSKNHFYGGRTQKIASVLASFATTRFNSCMQFNQFYQSEHDYDDDNNYYYGWEAYDPGFFDARVFSVPDWETVAQVLSWRLFDCRRNALHSIAQANFNHKSIVGKPLKDLIDRLLKEKNIDAYKEYPKENVFGCFVKKVQETVDGRNPKTGETIPTVRNRIISKSFDFNGKSFEEIVEFVKNPFFKEEDDDLIKKLE